MIQLRLYEALSFTLSVQCTENQGHLTDIKREEWDEGQRTHVFNSGDTSHAQEVVDNPMKTGIFLPRTLDTGAHAAIICEDVSWCCSGLLAMQWELSSRALQAAQCLTRPTYPLTLAAHAAGRCFLGNMRMWFFSARDAKDCKASFPKWAAASSQ